MTVAEHPMSDNVEAGLRPVPTLSSRGIMNACGAAGRWRRIRTRPDAGGFVVFQVLIGIASLALPLFVVSGVAVATPIVVLEDGRNATAAIGRSWFLTKGYRLRVTGLLFVCLILILIPYAGLLTGGAALASNTGTPLTIWIAAVALAARLLLTPLLYCLITLLYYDLRVRKEGFDLEMLAASLQPA